MIRAARRVIRRAWVPALLGAVLVCSSLIGTSARLDVSTLLLDARDQPIDLLVTAGADPSTALGGHPYLAPDAWMTQGLISDDQIRRIEAIPGVDIVAPVTVLPTVRKPFGETTSGWIPAEPGTDVAWTAELSATLTDGTGTRRTDPRRVGVLMEADTALVTPGISAVSLRRADGEYVTVLDEGGYRLTTMTRSGMLATTYLASARAFAVAVDPEAEARLARQAGQEDLAESLDTLALLSSADNAGTMEAAAERMSPPLTRGQPLPALVSTESRGSMVVEASVETRTPGDAGAQASNPQAGCTVFRLVRACHGLTADGVARLEAMPLVQVHSSSLSSPVQPWGGTAHPYTATGADGEVVVMTQSVFWNEPEAPSSTVLTTLNRQDTSGGAGPSARVQPVLPPVAVGSHWHDEVYRPHASRPSGVPALSILAGEADTYQPAVEAFLPGTSPVSASTLRTNEGAVVQTLDATGAATSAAPALVSRELLSSFMDGSSLGATVLRVRLDRPAGEPPADAEVERVAARISQAGLHVSVLTGASAVDVAVQLDGQDPVAWHGRATETWTELGAVLRVERASGLALALLPVLAVLVVGVLALVVERNASVLRGRQARALLSAGWSGRSVRRRLVADRLPGIAVVLGACAVAVHLASARAVAHSGAGTGMIVTTGILACAGIAALSWWDGYRACRPDRLPPPAQPPAAAGRRRAGPARALHGLIGHLLDRSTVLSTAWRAHWPGRWAVTAAALAAGALSALAIQVLSATALGAGSSRIALQGTGVVAGACRTLFVLAACATAVILGAGLRDARRAARDRQRILAGLGWPRLSRAGVEIALWARQFGAVAVLSLAAAAPGGAGPWSGQGPGPAPAVLVGAGAAVAAVLLIVAPVMVGLALLASTPGRIPLAGRDDHDHPGEDPR